MYVTVRDTATAGSGGPARTGLRRVARTVILLGIVSLLTDVSSEMVNAVLPLYLTAELGLSLIAYGFIDGIYQGVSSLVRIAGGFAADRGQHPKWVAVLGYGVSALSRIALIPVHGFGVITAVITADRLGKGLRTGPRDALIADASEPEMLGRSFGVHRALDTAGAAAGPLVAVLLLLAVPGQYNPIFVVSFAFALVGFAVLVLLVPNRRTGTGTVGPRFRQLVRQIGARPLRRPMVAAALLGVVTVGDGFLYLSLQQRDNFAAAYFPLLYVGTNVVYLALAVPLGRLADRIGRAKVFLGGHIALLLGYLAAGGPATGLAATLLTLALLGVFYAATDGVLAALVSRIAPGESRSTAISAAQTVVAVARFVSSLAFGALWTTLGRGPALLLVAGALVLVLPIAAWLVWPADRRPLSGDPPRQRQSEPSNEAAA
jgi:MFS family permease